MSKDELEVNEGQYTKVGDGPKEDTGAFYVGTPMPGERRIDSREPTISGRIRRATPGWIKREKTPNVGVPIEERGQSSMVLFWVAGFAAVGIAMVAVAAIVIIATSPPEEQKQTATVEAEEEKSYQGLKVKKGLQDE